MAELVVGNGIVIDEIENVIFEIQKLSGKRLADYEVIKLFVNKEKFTKFYIDGKLNSYVEYYPGATYLWLDSGFVDTYGNPIMISLHKYNDGFVGHITGTIKYLVKSIKERNSRCRKHIDSNYSTFINKYNKKVEERTYKHIEDINSFIIAVSNGEAATTVANAFSKLNLADFAIDTSVESDTEEIQETVDEIIACEFSEIEEEITIGLLIEKLDGMELYIKALQNTIEDLTKKQEMSAERINELEAKKRAYEQDFVMIRDYMSTNMDSGEDAIEEDKIGHSLLSGNGKILVLGASGIGTDKLSAIAKRDYGFDKNDIDFETDYYNGANLSERILKGGKYKYVIIGAVPHSAKGRLHESSIVESLKKNGNFELVIDGRSKSGKLKLTKESYRDALNKIVLTLRERAIA